MSGTRVHSRFERLEIPFIQRIAKHISDPAETLDLRTEVLITIHKTNG